MKSSLSGKHQVRIQSRVAVVIFKKMSNLIGKDSLINLNNLLQTYFIKNNPNSEVMVLMMRMMRCCSLRIANKMWQQWCEPGPNSELDIAPFWPGELVQEKHLAGWTITLVFQSISRLIVVQKGYLYIYI